MQMFLLNSFGSFEDLLSFLLDVIEKIGAFLLLWQFISVNALIFEQNEKDKTRDYETTCIITWGIFKKEESHFLCNRNIITESSNRFICLMPAEKKFDLSEYFKDDLILFEKIIEAINDQHIINRNNKYNEIFQSKQSDQCKKEIVKIPDFLVTLDPYQFLHDPSLMIDLTCAEENIEISQEDKLQMRKDEEEFHRRVRNLLSEILKSSQWPHFAHANKTQCPYDYEDASYTITCERDAGIKLTRIWLLFPSELEFLRKFDFSNEENIQQTFLVQHQRWIQKLKNFQKWANLEHCKPPNYSSNSVLTFYTNRNHFSSELTRSKLELAREDSSAADADQRKLIHRPSVDRGTFPIKEESEDSNGEGEAMTEDLVIEYSSKPLSLFPSFCSQ
jgi:hypothetical protein